MQDALKTRGSRLISITQGRKIKCAEAGRTKGRKCGSTLLIDGKTICQAGHEFTLGELFEAACEINNKWNAKYMGDAVKWLIDVLIGTGDDSKQQGRIILEKFLSPPFTLPAENPCDASQDWFFTWAGGYSLLLYIIDYCYLSNHGDALEKQVIGRFNERSEIRQALEKLTRAIEKGDFGSKMKRRHLIECILRASWFRKRGREGLIHYYPLRYYLELQGYEILGGTDETELILTQDSLMEAVGWTRYNFANPVFFTEAIPAHNEVRYHIPVGDNDAISVRIQNGWHCFFEYGQPYLE